MGSRRSRRKRREKPDEYPEQVWTVAAFASLVLTLFAMLLPIPVWASRAIRGRPPRLALPPTSEGSKVDRALVELAKEVDIALSIVESAGEAVADYAASSFFARWMDRGSTDNWAKAIVRRASYEELEAYRAVERVLEAADDIPDGVRAPVEAPLSDLASGLRSVDGTVDAGKPGRHPTRKELLGRKVRLDHLAGGLRALYRAITEPPKDPYR